MRMKEFAGKTAFVTGAASGIGLGIATAFAQAGAKVKHGDDLYSSAMFAERIMIRFLELSDQVEKERNRRRN
jgi:NAD(P)-dependent dehydrogenase (short-subunit alcohol dehydrogenase family)